MIDFLYSSASVKSKVIEGAANAEAPLMKLMVFVKHPIFFLFHVNDF
jgi:hypothetical protein